MEKQQQRTFERLEQNIQTQNDKEYQQSKEVFRNYVDPKHIRNMGITAIEKAVISVRNEIGEQANG